MKRTRWWSPGLGVLVIAGFFYQNSAFSKIDPMGISTPTNGSATSLSSTYDTEISRDRSIDKPSRAEHTKVVEAKASIPEERVKTRLRIPGHF